jgi:hypothetical protein
LAWQPHSPEPYDYYAEYVELHPRVGEAVISTLAVTGLIQVHHALPRARVRNDGNTSSSEGQFLRAAS